MRSIFVSILAFCFLLVSGIALCADSTAFDPTLVAVKAKGAGGVPVGTIISWPVATDPEDMDNWLECNGQSISQSAYPELFAVVGNQVPDLRGLFLRGLGGNSDKLLKFQDMMIQSHKHRIPYPAATSYNGGPGFPGTGYGVSFDTNYTGGIETRPVNMAVRYLIRARP